MPGPADDGLILDRGARRAVLASMCLALVLVIAGLAMLYVALPAIGADLRASQSEQQWIVDAYAVALSALLLPAGAIGDRYGRRGTLLAGIVCFGAACLASALAHSPGMLIVWRVAAGAAAAFIMPATLATITSVFPEEERAKAVGVWVGFAGGGAMIGMVMAGALLESFWWGAAFLVIAGFSAGGFLATVLTVPKTSNPEDANIDPLGSLLSCVAVGSLVFGIIEGPVHGWTDGLTLTAFAVAAVSGAVLVAWELRTPAPLLDPHLFGDRRFATGTISLLILFLTMFGWFLVVLQFFQLILGYSALKAALLLMPVMAVMLPVSIVAATLSERFGMRTVSGVGILTTVAGFLWLSSAQVDSSFWRLSPGFLVFAAGTGLAMTPGTNAIVASLPPEKQGVASAVNDAAREIGSAFGIAILGSALNAGYRSEIDSVLGGLPPAAAGVVKGSPAGALAVAGKLGPAGDAVAGAAREAFVVGMRWAFLVAAALLLVVGLYVWWQAPGRDAVPTRSQAPQRIEPAV